MLLFGFKRLPLTELSYAPEGTLEGNAAAAAHLHVPSSTNRKVIQLNQIKSATLFSKL